jgi:hypothetical protein
MLVGGGGLPATVALGVVVVVGVVIIVVVLLVSELRRLEMLIDLGSWRGEPLACMLGGLRGTCGGNKERPLLNIGEE